MNFEALVAKYNGKVINDYGGECVALIAHYCLDNGKPIAYANAKDWWKHPALTGAFDFITNNPNDPNQLPPHSAVIIWNGNLPGSGGAGHIAAFDTKVSPGVFRSLDNNWGGRYVHFVTHNWGYVQGWMVPKATPKPQGGIVIPDQDNWFARFSKLMVQIRGRGLSREEFRQNFVGVEPFRMVEILSDNAEADAATNRPAEIQAQLGIVNQKVNEQNQLITGLTTDKTKSEQQMRDDFAKIASLNADLATAHDKIIELQKQPASTPQPPTPAQTQARGFIQWLKEFFGLN